MIEFADLITDEPFQILKKRYEQALISGEKNIHAMAISSFNPKTNQVDSRFVNLKIIKNSEFIFFTNYESPKAKSFELHNQISALLYWSSINFQIRLKAQIQKTSGNFNNMYFKSRDIDKNALAISSNQSKKIDSYNKVIEKFKFIRKNNNLTECPSYWGGYSFEPFEIEFWEGKNSRLNKRSLYEKKNSLWHQSFLEP